MQLAELLRDIPALVSDIPSEVPITLVTDDSRAVRPGALFVARPSATGTTDANRFVVDAIARGAVAIVGDASLELPAGADARPALIRVADPALATALLAERFAGSPTSRLRVIGVTGTNGKTTIAHLTQQLLGDPPGGASGGPRVGLIGTVEIDDGRSRVPSTLTTPGAVQLAELFARMVEHGCTYATMEVSSHALHQRRVGAIRFACGIFTNLTGDHLDYHGTMEAYAAAKAMLFASLDRDAFAIINQDDPWHSAMCVGDAQRLLCSASDPKADCLATIEEVRIDGMRIRFDGPWGRISLLLPLVGRHNAMNALEAVAAAWTQGVGAADLAARLERCEAPPGRLEPVPLAAEVGGFSVLVDYAHTDDALLNVLTALRSVVPSGSSLRVLFGCGGDRDRTKRPRMAGVACAHADQIVVTSDNPRTEDPHAIVADILKGVPEGTSGKVHVEVDRAAAIRWVVAQGKPGDIILIAGKGHEDYQIVGTEKRHFDDREQASDALEAIVKKRGSR
jgi:UDP-N-acetylmuramoyl-L-alanyl-D-glutamate--2,6-diaminopimelate ligase